jgi:cytochrome c biogenesis protein CcdA
MIRILIENMFFFLLPTLGYIAWVAFEKDDWPGLWEVLKGAPLVRLFVAGAALMLLTVALFASRSHNEPEDVYVPPVYKDGRIEPGHSAPESK